jgi:hypothetical protein
VRNLTQATTSPRCPKIKQDRFASKTLKGHFLAVDGRGRKIWRDHADLEVINLEDESLGGFGFI